MRDDDDEAEHGVHTVPTVPPPPGEEDVYDAKTQVGGLTDEALALLRQLRDERPLPAGLIEDAGVPVFEDDDNPPGPVPRVAPAAGKPAVAVTPVAPAFTTPAAPAARPPLSPAAPRASAPAIAPLPLVSRPSNPGLIRPGIAASVASSGATIKAAFAPSGATPDVPAAAPSARLAAMKAPTQPELSPAPPPQRELAPLFDDSDVDPEEPPQSYVAAFGPVSGNVAGTTESMPPPRRSRGLLIVTAVIVVALAVVLLGGAGWLSGVMPAR